MNIESKELTTVDKILVLLKAKDIQINHELKYKSPQGLCHSIADAIYDLIPHLKGVYTYNVKECIPEFGIDADLFGGDVEANYWWPIEDPRRLEYLDYLIDTIK